MQIVWLLHRRWNRGGGAGGENIVNTYTFILGAEYFIKYSTSHLILDSVFSPCHRTQRAMKASEKNTALSYTQKPFIIGKNKQLTDD